MKNDDALFDTSKRKRADKPVLTEKGKQQLLSIARETIEHYIRSHRIPKLNFDNPELNQQLGAFVTLTIQGQLRGCIGRFEPDMPVAEVVQEMALAAATQDPRFSPVTQADLNKIRIEISVLTPRWKIDDINEIEVGKHGLYITRDWCCGTLLPQVATEYCGPGKSSCSILAIKQVYLEKLGKIRKLKSRYIALRFFMKQVN